MERQSGAGAAGLFALSALHRPASARRGELGRERPPARPDRALPPAAGRLQPPASRLAGQGARFYFILLLPFCFFVFFVALLRIEWNATREKVAVFLSFFFWLRLSRIDPRILTRFRSQRLGISNRQRAPSPAKVSEFFLWMLFLTDLTE